MQGLPSVVRLPRPSDISEGGVRGGLGGVEGWDRPNAAPAAQFVGSADNLILIVKHLFAFFEFL